MRLTLGLALQGASLVLAACSAGAPLGPAMVVTPGKDKNEAAFRQDEAICQQHAIAHTGYGESIEGPVGGTSATPVAPVPSAGSASVAAPPGGAPVAPGDAQMDGQGYMQCMAARGDVVQLASVASYDAGYAQVYPYNPAYAYPYGYAYPAGDPFMVPLSGVFVGGFGWWHGGGWHHGWGHHGWNHGGWHHGGWGHGGFHGGGGHH